MAGWISIAGALFGITILFLGIGWGSILKMRYTGPYTLKKSSTQQRWRWATNLACFYTFSGLGMIVPLIITALNNSASLGSALWNGIALCALPLIVVFPLVVLKERLEFEYSLKRYLSWDKKRNDPLTKQILGHWFFRSLTLLIWDDKGERQRFLREGYSDEDNH